MKQVCTLFFIAIAISTTAQKNPPVQAQKCLGGTKSESADAISETKDGGCIISGYSNSNDGDVSGLHGIYYDAWLIKLNRYGTIEWQKCFGGSKYENARSVHQTADGGFIFTGPSYSNDGDIANHYGFTIYSDYWVVKLDGSGNIQWQNSLGGTDDDYPAKIQQTKDSGYIVIGYSNSNNRDVTGNHGGADCWAVKLNSLGKIQWQKSLGGAWSDNGESIQQTKDNGYIIAGSTESNDGDVSGNHGISDYWIVKLDSSGNIQWQKTLGGTGIDNAADIQQTSDNGYIVAGTSASNNGNVSGNHGGYDYWVVKLNTSGNIQWQISLGGSADEQAHSVEQTTDGGYIVAGNSLSTNGDVSGNHGKLDSWIVKLNASGKIQWTRSVGGTKDDVANCIQQVRTGGYIVGGFSNSNDGDVSGNHGNYDDWVVKLSASGNITEQQLNLTNAGKYNQLKLSLAPNPVHSMLHITGLLQTIIYKLEITGDDGVVLKTVAVKNVSSYDMDVSALPADIYYLRAGEETAKFIKD